MLLVLGMLRMLLLRVGLDRTLLHLRRHPLLGIHLTVLRMRHLHAMRCLLVETLSHQGMGALLGDVAIVAAGVVGRSRRIGRQRRFIPTLRFYRNVGEVQVVMRCRNGRGKIRFCLDVGWQSRRPNGLGLGVPWEGCNLEFRQFVLPSLNNLSVMIQNVQRVLRE